VLEELLDCDSERTPRLPRSSKCLEVVRVTELFDETIEAKMFSVDSRLSPLLRGTWLFS
jgi:hypothetical protein